MSEQSTIHDLRTAIIDMDALSQSGFREIRAISKLALMALETPNGQRSVEEMAMAFETIWGLCESCEGSINAHAEQVGCAHENHRFHGRLKAASEAQCVKQ
ncbi:hypothetical protein PIN31115_02826 [Pandoraea iniqua]|uniref:Uncharacterized protein n=1 Tax=Pandoraea iniqua TaxID=2508288 RepID=A0A5E4VRX0_9BURK|nr:hypothetical protein [Pandoraea iniqua]VVE14981.1 hypothetical protein PIN31115_02826 [Pandoraea iniqua]